MKLFARVLSVSMVMTVAVQGHAYTCTPGTGQVALYRDGNFSGPCTILSWGNYANAAQMGIANDSVSSVIVGPGTRALLYQDSNFSAKLNTLEGSWASSTFYASMGVNANDSASSIRVARIDGGNIATNYLGNLPNNRESYWTDEIQGLAHDDSHWYMTQNPRGDSPQLMVWPLSTNMSGYPSLRVAMPWQLNRFGCDHFGDPDLFQHPVWGGLLVVPVEGCRDPYGDMGGAKVGVVALFRAADLSFFAMDTLFAQGQGGASAEKAAWLAIHPITKTTLFSSSNVVDVNNPVVAYEVDWDDLQPNDNPAYFLWGGYGTAQLWDAEAQNYPWIYTPQGGVFSSDGRVFYLVNGYGCDTGDYIRAFDADGFSPYQGNTFSMRTASASEYGKFNFESHCSTGEEPQGMDYLDMTGRGMPFSGQLHVMLLDNDEIDQDNLYLKHYSITP